MASYLDKMSAKALSCWCSSSNIVIERRARSLIGGRRIVSGRTEKGDILLFQGRGRGRSYI